MHDHMDFQCSTNETQPSDQWKPVLHLSLTFRSSPGSYMLGASDWLAQRCISLDTMFDWMMNEGWWFHFIGWLSDIDAPESNQVCKFGGQNERYMQVVAGQEIRKILQDVFDYTFYLIFARDFYVVIVFSRVVRTKFYHLWVYET